MGTSKRYADHFDRLGLQHMYDRAMAEGTPDSLKKFEIDLDHEPLTIAPEPRPVTAWVRYHGEPVRVQGWAFRWTDRAVGIAWNTAHGEVHRAWVWAGAVTARTPKADEKPPTLPAVRS